MQPGRVRGEHDNRPLVLEIARLRARAGPAARDSPPTPTRRSPTRPCGSAPRDRRVSRPAGRPGRRQRRRRGARCSPRSPPRTASNWRRGTGRTTPNGSGPSSTTSTPPRCGRISTWSGCCTTGFLRGRRSLYGIEMVPRPDLVGYHPDVRVWEVRDADGKPIGLFLGDYFAREGKRGGAWMSNFVDQSFLLGLGRWSFNVLNMPATRRRRTGPARRWTRSARCSTSSATPCTACSRRSPTRGCPGPMCRATSSSTPSQVNEMWILWPEVLENYARHVRHRRAAARPSRRRHSGRRAVGRGLRHHRVPRRDPAGPGLAPHHAGHRRSPTWPSSSGRRLRTPASRTR